jgi:hypothetical protein
VDRVVELINPILRGWVNYFAVGHSSECFSFILVAHGYQKNRKPTHGYEPTREAAMQAFARSWHRGT